MKTSKLVLVAILLAGFSVGANATVINLGNVTGDTDTIEFGHSIKKNRSFIDYVRFRIDDAFSLEGFFKKYELSDFGVKLEHRLGAGSGWEVLDSFVSDFSYANLAAGVYRFRVDGTTGIKPGFWRSEANFAAPVPEADTILMLLIGGGMIALQLRRKQRSLGLQPLVAAA